MDSVCLFVFQIGLKTELRLLKAAELTSFLFLLEKIFTFIMFVCLFVCSLLVQNKCFQ